jgi:hypothetical protein
MLQYAPLVGERSHYEPGTFCWVGLATSDRRAVLERACHDRCRARQGVLRRAYFTVENVDDAARDAERLGGRLLSRATEIHIGRFAVIADPLGAAFAVLEGETDP